MAYCEPLFSTKSMIYLIIYIQKLYKYYKKIHKLTCNKRVLMQKLYTVYAFNLCAFN